VKNRIISISLAIMLALSVGLVGCGGEEAPETTEYSLSISSTEGGSVITPGEGTFTYQEGEVVSLIAKADEGYQFVSWTGDIDDIADVEDPTTTITMDDNYSITANFAVIPSGKYGLVISSTVGGEVTSPGEGTFNYEEGTNVTLLAFPHTGYHFVSWTGDVTNIDDVSATSTTITMNGNYSIKANFEAESSASAIWPKFQYDTANTGRSPNPSIIDPAIVWSFATEGYVRSSPVIAADGTIYIGSEDTRLYAINPDGTLRWSYPTWGQINAGAPAIGSEGTIYVGSVVYPGSLRARLYAIGADGTLKWEFTSSSAGDFDGFSPTIGPDGTVYAVADKLYAINPDGTLAWSYNTGRASATPALGPSGTIYVPSSSDGKLYAINPNGTLRWSCQVDAADVANLWSSPSIGPDGSVFFGTAGDNKLYVVNPDGSLRWTFQANHCIRQSPTIGCDGTIYVGETYLSQGGAPEEGFTFYAINPDGTLAWSSEPWAAITSSASIASDGTIYFASFSRLYALHPDGSQRWMIELGGSVHGSVPAIGANGEIYIGAYDGKLYAIHGEAIHG